LPPPAPPATGTQPWPWPGWRGADSRAAQGGGEERQQVILQKKNRCNVVGLEPLNLLRQYASGQNYSVPKAE